MHLSTTNDASAGAVNLRDPAYKAVFSKILPHLASVEYAGESALTKMCA